MSSDRAAHSRNRAANSEVESTRSRTTRSSSLGSNANSSAPGSRVSLIGMRKMMPSSIASVWGSNPRVRTMRSVTAIAHGSWTRRP